MIVQFQFRRGTSAQWASANPTLDAGEPGYDITNRRFKMGDGFTSWGNLEYQTSNMTELNEALANLDEAVAAAEASADRAEFFAGNGDGDGGGTAVVPDPNDLGFFLVQTGTNPDGLVEDPSDPGFYMTS